MSYYCYILRSINPLYEKRTYVGMTVDPTRRIRQHNGELVGGAKATIACRPHEMYCIIKGFPTINEAMSYEWHIKHADGKRRSNKFKGIEGRLHGLINVMEKKTPTFPLTIWIKEEYVDLLNNLISESEIAELDELLTIKIMNLEEE